MNDTPWHLPVSALRTKPAHRNEGEDRFWLSTCGESKLMGLFQCDAQDIGCKGAAN